MKQENTNLPTLAEKLGSGWPSKILSDFGTLRVKLFAIDPAGLAEDCHEEWDEALFVVEGHCALQIEDDVLNLRAGDYANIPKGKRHAILPGGAGSILLIDPEPVALRESGRNPEDLT